MKWADEKKYRECFLKNENAAPAITQKKRARKRRNSRETKGFSSSHFGVIGAWKKLPKLPFLCTKFPNDPIRRL
jgi:hypothetical protein